MVSEFRKTASTSQTLSRGIRVLEVLADAQEPLSVDRIAERLGVHRSIAYRLIRTLEEHGLLTREPAGKYELGARLAALAAGIKHDLQAAALPELTAVANELGMTCFVAVMDREECVTLVSVEPRHAVASVAQRPGSRHPFTAGAPGRAILSQLPAEDWPEDVREVADRGYADSHGEVIENLSSVAVPLPLRGHAPAALAVVYLSSTRAPAELAERLKAAAKAVRDALGG
ncbi:DNA-binding transcriptional regulator, IclR family [Amycolatopsis lurida]|uniref:Glycerol operon regulatory protein n=1 Tax=Amycolatopsis lurida NRRL 2430 TaxID=1460371 RepID=A0A2P2FKU6_AMYLU|nr:helix-turn-helix domain-containing protein [Amycolatopsis lurida]KFU77342.1 ArsR family transcriptional regulator [Amycolatopsis lurida NRRL 2430]SEB35360.1 DNA-binding transcriptional regulator, IclR family [Amycolatopsis lurida]